MNHERNEIEFDLQEVFYILKKKILLIILVAVLGAVAAGVYSFLLASPIYQSTAKVYILSQSTSLTSFADIQISSSLTTDYEEMITGRRVVGQVKENLNLDMKYEDIVEMVTIENPPDTRILNISVESTDAQEAADMANEFAEVSREQISRIMETDEPALFETAIVEDDPIKPQKARNTILGFLIGLILSAFVVIVLHVLNDNIKNQEDVERYLNLNTLANVPLEKGSKGKKEKKGTLRRER
ncbi:YveK family protein [Zhenpiania hominis]|uniref:Polysaccharide export protein n=1 Tax=Zhenpiania hominis TaxID=2763644 RepID=A0A923NLW8_9FIRM|nr:Wzz/FepE/Etk N-terminal domain-containing protein [Zhenpiania hominis]MBC6679577.1 polysaccharide export protein [Zhenpiania hominis]